MNSKPVLAIAKWSEVYETAESRRHNSLHWISMPIDFNSTGFNRLLDEFGDEAAAVYGAWCALVAFAAKQQTRGVLANSRGEPVSWHHVSRDSGFPAKLFETLARWAVKVGWLLPVDSGVAQENCHSAQPSPSRRPGKLPSCPGDAQEKHNFAQPSPRQNGDFPGLQDKTRQDTTRHNKTRHLRASTSTSTSTSTRDVDADALKFLVKEEELADVLRECREVAKIVKPFPIEKNRTQHLADRSLIFKAVVLARRHFSEDWLRDSVEAVRMQKNRTRPPCAYFHGVLSSKAAELGENLSEWLRKVDDKQSLTNPLAEVAQ